MRPTAFILAFALAAPAWGQDKPAPEKAPEKKEPAKVAVSKKPNPKRMEDARHCLEKPTNTEIIKCSEEYL
jgi:hypothetical protein